MLSLFRRGVLSRGHDCATVQPAFEVKLHNMVVDNNHFWCRSGIHFEAFNTTPSPGELVQFVLRCDAGISFQILLVMLTLEFLVLSRRTHCA